MERKIVSLQVGDSKYIVGNNGVKLIEVQPPLAGIDYETHAISIYSPMEKMIWRHEEDLIAIPKLVLDETARVQS